MQNYKSIDGNGYKIGVISDTHGLYRPEINKAFEGVNLILHAGDIGKPEILKLLEEIAPVIAVRGNVDNSAWCSKYPFIETVNINDNLIYIIHKVSEFDYKESGKPDVLIFGHSHKPLIKQENNILYFNPGSAGPQRFSLPVTAGILEIKDNNISAHHIELK